MTSVCSLLKKKRKAVQLLMKFAVRSSEKFIREGQAQPNQPKLQGL